MEVYSETVIFLDIARLLHTQTHSSCDCMLKTDTNQVSQNLRMDGGEAHEVPPLAEETDGCWGSESQLSSRVKPLRGSKRCSYTVCTQAAPSGLYGFKSRESWERKAVGDWRREMLW